MRRSSLFLLVLFAGAGCDAGSGDEPSVSEVYDLVVLGGRVMDPESDLDDVRNLGISGAEIRSVTTAPVVGRDTLDAAGKVVAPGFIDLHAHGQDNENYRIRVRDGFTTALELELGSADVVAFYQEREGRSIIHHGVSAGHVPVRIRVMQDPGSRVPVGPGADRAASPDELAAIISQVRAGLEAGALAVGLSLQNTPAASFDEVLALFQLAAEFEVGVHVHLRFMGSDEGGGSPAALDEVIAAAEVVGVPVHVAHVHSSGLDATDELLASMEAARRRGVDVSTEVYPYTAGQTNIEAPLFSGDWQALLGIGYADIQWVATGERLDAESFARYRETGGLVVIHMIPEEALEAALLDPFTMIASDGLLQDGSGHPRAAGTASRVLGRYVREEKTLTMMDAIRKLTYLPARRMERAVPAMARKGRIAPGADADIVIFRPDDVKDEATYGDPARPPTGIDDVLVNGAHVVRNGALREGILAGRGVRRHISRRP